MERVSMYVISILISIIQVVILDVLFKISGIPVMPAGEIAILYTVLTLLNIKFGEGLVIN